MDAVMLATSELAGPMGLHVLRPTFSIGLACSVAALSGCWRRVFRLAGWAALRDRGGVARANLPEFGSGCDRIIQAIGLTHALSFSDNLVLQRGARL